MTPILLTLHCKPQTMLRWLSEACAVGLTKDQRELVRRAGSVINNLELIKVSDKSMESVVRCSFSLSPIDSLSLSSSLRRGYDMINNFEITPPSLAPLSLFERDRFAAPLTAS